MLLVIIGCVLFDTKDLPSALAYLSAMFGLNGAGAFIDNNTIYQFINYGIVLAIAAFGSVPLIKNAALKVSARVQSGGKAARALFGAGTAALAVAALVLSTAYLADAGYNPFLYFNF